MYGWLNLLSLALGLLAWILPLVSLARLKRVTRIHALHRTCFVSFLCCALALVIQYQTRIDLMTKGAVGALEEIVYFPAVLLAGTVLVNLPLLLFSACDDETAKGESAPNQSNTEVL